MVSRCAKYHSGLAAPEPVVTTALPVLRKLPCNRSRPSSNAPSRRSNSRSIGARTELAAVEGAGASTIADRYARTRSRVTWASTSGCSFSIAAGKSSKRIRPAPTGS